MKLVALIPTTGHNELKDGCSRDRVRPRNYGRHSPAVNECTSQSPASMKEKIRRGSVSG